MISGLDRSGRGLVCVLSSFVPEGTE